MGVVNLAHETRQGVQNECVSPLFAVAQPVPLSPGSMEILEFSLNLQVAVNQWQFLQ